MNTKVNKSILLTMFFAFYKFKPAVSCSHPGIISTSN